MSGKKMKSSKQMGRKKHYLEPETVDLEYDEFSPSAPNFSTGTIPLQYRETSHYLSECHLPYIFPTFCFHFMWYRKQQQKNKRGPMPSFSMVV